MLRGGLDLLARGSVLILLLTLIRYNTAYKKFYKRLVDLSSKQNQKPLEKKFETLAARAVFVSLFFFKKSYFMTFWQEIITLTRSIRRGV